MIDTLELSMKLRAAGLSVAAADAIAKALFEETQSLRRSRALSSNTDVSLPFNRTFLLVTSGIGTGLLMAIIEFVLAKLMIRFF
ncbi:hypothetical protein ASG35_03075 [Burkholderia sp. Leaf177]|uniref:hypothetical protein n=1 Tax=Burkholderia sp. Leaf177 TaxID=1736287 RepID=UPI0006F275F6|nr:hypothetical protein [Burkholderia sp. Leaf177]KQR90208.1 hypothetical protein ASG35_03075 [Burkholderia sp. Leaf177]